MSTETLLVNSAVAALRQCTDRIGVCIPKLNEDQIWARGHKTENAVGNLILHLAGNVRQWMMAGLGGKPDVRVREKEFAAAGGMSPVDLMVLLRETIEEATAVIESLGADQLTAIYVIQDRTVSGVEAIMNVVRHFAEHTGQIIFVTKNLTGEDLGLWGPRTAPNAGNSAASA